MPAEIPAGEPVKETAGKQGIVVFISVAKRVVIGAAIYVVAIWLFDELVK